MIIATSNPDASVRASGVRSILQALSAASASADDPSTLVVRARQINALLGRLGDSNPKVVEAVYSLPDVLNDARVVNRVDLIARVRAVLHPDAVEGEAPSRAVIAQHLAYFAHINDATHAMDVFEALYAPYLLVSKAKRKTAMVAWNSLTKSESAVSTLVKGCQETIQVYEARDDEDDRKDLEAMTELNVVLAGKIACAYRFISLAILGIDVWSSNLRSCVANIITSNDYARHFDFLLSSAKQPAQPKQDAHTRLWALLVLRALLGQLTGANLVDAANGVLDVIDPACLGTVTIEDELKTVSTYPMPCCLVPDINHFIRFIII